MLTRISRFLRRILYLLFFAFLGLLLIGHLVGCVRDFQLYKLRRSDAQIRASYAHSLAANPGVYRYQVGTRTIRYVEFGKDTSNVILFLHGSPSSHSIFDSYLRDSTLLRRAMLVGVDRPGYGYSDFGQIETSIIRQAELLQPLIDKYKHRRLVIIGSSYGGSVAVRIGMYNAAKIKHLFLVSASVAPHEERTYGISYMMSNSWFGWMFPTVLRMATAEKLSHSKALMDMGTDWDKITCPVTIMHGNNDGLVYPVNADYAQARLINAPIRMFLFDGIGHSIIWDKKPLLIQHLIAALE
jgi:pimeloyl-ACP methyl ester carboxylesterase